ncbi:MULTISPECIES: YceI family protein [Flavobacterium]|jgi:polyisoprenoid-binding protein YceI|uniref:YceI family protein n=1 Tax=Flavobacterium cupriresistens TaxID=2893885 RepID=A0ABU4RDD3_9FLAO|nr:MULTISPECIES: YceI family protein [unclassified Flavobacterium]KLT69867.1 hypothetical protein AB674_09155 [Flavobacterium sp. ABG]MDX6189684.1 YceI family protein [Flavobacterium sp. Fl-318]UFH40910.1 YceI family protein [Flavobacterium sp. F-323]
MKTKKIKSILLTFICLGIAFYAKAQKNYTVDTKSLFSVTGTSTLHDWEMKSDTGTGTANITALNHKITEINSLTIMLLAESIKNEKNGINKAAYETLNTKTHKNIKYVLKSAEKVNESTWNLTGIYTIAGVSKEYKTQIKTSFVNEIINLQGVQKITFADFGMTPPKALLGTIKTGKDLTINFNLFLK